MQLLDRSHRPPELTPAGECYYDGCSRLVAQYRDLEARVRREPDSGPLQIRVAAIYSVGLGDMHTQIERFREAMPETDVRIAYHHPDKVYAHVLDGTADLGLVSFPRRMRELASVPWRDERMVLACAPGHRLARGRKVSPRDLNGLPYVAFDRGLAIRRQIDRFLREHEAEANVVLAFDNIENIKKAIEIDAGVAILPEPTLSREAESGTLAARALDACDFVRPLGIIMHRRKRLSRSAHAFADFLREPGDPQAEPSANSLAATG